MTTTLSEASLLLAEHWMTYQDLRAAENMLRMELSALLASIQPTLAANTWWAKGWEFEAPLDGQFYIARHDWRLPDVDTHVVWIGVENFTPEHLFGLDMSPTLYVWVYGGRRQQLAEILSERLLAQSLLGNDRITNQTRGGGIYVISRPITRHPTEHLLLFATEMHRQLLEFTEHYAVALSDFGVTGYV
jgi:hypothetical protein